MAEKRDKLIAFRCTRKEAVKLMRASMKVKGPNKGNDSFIIRGLINEHL
jgi:hypothetical protein